MILKPFFKIFEQDQDLVKLFQDIERVFKSIFFEVVKRLKLMKEEISTQLKLAKQFTVQAPKKCLIDDDRYKIFFKTDAVNDYFDRDISPGASV